MFWRIYPLAIMLGLAAGSGIAALVSAFALLWSTSGEIDAFSAVIAEDAGFHVAMLVSSIVSSFFAGWVAARFALGEELINAFATGAVLAAFGMANTFEPFVGDVPGWVKLSSFGVAVPFSALGALVYRGRVSAV